jgi:hypothetical protein
LDASFKAKVLRRFKDIREQKEKKMHFQNNIFDSNHESELAEETE